MLPRHLRLRRPQDFRIIRRKGKSWANKYLVLSTLPNGREHNRYGFVVSKQIGNAVIRNRTKRRLRALIRNRLKHHQPGFDIVIVGRKQSALATYENLQRNLAELEKRAGIVNPRSESSLS